MLDFKSLLPSYERNTVICDRAGLRALGCSEDLIENICVPGCQDFQLYARPEDWFWTDRRAFGHGGPWVDELYNIAGGCFADLPIQTQCSLLGLDVQELPLRRAHGTRGKWLNKAGDPVPVEEAALEAALTPGQAGFHVEGALLSALRIMVHRIALHRFKGSYSLDEAVGRDPATEQHVEQVLSSLNLLLEKADRFVPELWPRMNGAARHVTVEDLLCYTAKMPTGLIESIIEIAVRRGSRETGHPDLTILGNSVLFAEVKVQDRLWGTQAKWINDVARPLDLDVIIMKVVEV